MNGYKNIWPYELENGRLTKDLNAAERAWGNLRHYSADLSEGIPAEQFRAIVDAERLDRILNRNMTGYIRIVHSKRELEENPWSRGLYEETVTLADGSARRMFVFGDGEEEGKRYYFDEERFAWAFFAVTLRWMKKHY